MATLVVVTFGLSGCATMSQGELTCLVSAGVGAVVGAALHEDEEKGALIGAAVGALGCGVYRYLNENQAAEMVEKQDGYLSAVPLGEPIDVEFPLTPAPGSTAPVVHFRAETAVAANTLLGDDEGASSAAYCRRIRSEVRPSADEDADPSVHEQLRCLNAEGDWESVTSPT